MKIFCALLISTFVSGDSKCCNLKSLLKSLIFNCVIFTIALAASPQNETEEEKADQEEIQNLNSLLNGYKSIQLRFNQKSLTGPRFQNWNYDSSSTQGRPDRHRSKFTPTEAIEQLHNLDKLFPLYDHYFNVTNSTESEEIVADILSERIKNIEVKLGELQKSNMVNEAGRFGGISQIFVVAVMATSSLHFYFIWKSRQIKTPYDWIFHSKSVYLSIFIFHQ